MPIEELYQGLAERDSLKQIMRRITDCRLFTSDEFLAEDIFLN
jgi:hypothetical protein